jgi:hypothetical protein
MRPLPRRKAHKRNQISALETLTVEAGLLLTDPKDFEARSDEKTAKQRVRAKKGKGLEAVEHRARQYAGADQKVVCRTKIG